jgi:ubiquinone/menaquinone biosynthesis C-methylase UbiE
MEQSDSSSAAKIYEEYLGRSIADPFTRVLLELAHPGKAERVLDLASGTGSVARHVAPMVGRQGRVVALDINPEMLAVGRALPQPQGAVIEWLEGDAVRTALPDSGFGLILCQQGLQFFRDRHAALVEMRRLLAPGGRVLISVWQALSRHPIYEALFKAVAGHSDSRFPLSTFLSLWDRRKS